MGRVSVEQADVRDGQLVRMKVRLGERLVRTLDRDTVVSWMRDHHSFVAGATALQLVEISDGDDTTWFVRTDNALEPSDLMPRLPPVA